MDNRYVKILASGSKAPLKATPGHFATNHSHINYYLDMTTMKTRQNEAERIAKHRRSQNILQSGFCLIRW